MKEKRSIITGLTVREERFCESKADGLTNYDAYIESFGVGNAKVKTIREKASRLSRRYNVEARIEQLLVQQRERSAIKRDWIVDHLKRIVEVGTERTQLVEVKTTKNVGEFAEIIEERSLEKMVDASNANSSLDKLIRMSGLYAAEKTEVENTVRGKFVLNMKPRTDIEPAKES